MENAAKGKFSPGWWWALHLFNIGIWILFHMNFSINIWVKLRSQEKLVISERLGSFKLVISTYTIKSRQYFPKTSYMLCFTLREIPISWANQQRKLNKNYVINSDWAQIIQKIKYLEKKQRNSAKKRRNKIK